MRWRRGDEGFELGAVAVSTVIVIGALMVAMGIGVVLTWPDIAVAPLLAVLGPAALILPVLAYPMSYTVWQALDLAMRPVTIDDFDIEVIGRSLDVRSEDA